MDIRIKVKNVFEPEAVHKEFYTGGVIELLRDGSHLLCQCRGHITVISIENGKVVQTIPTGLENYNAFEDDDKFEDVIITFVLNKDNERVASAHKSGLIQLWNWREGKIEKTWKSIHKGPISKLCFNEDGSCLVTGGIDSCIRLWDTETGACVSKLGGLQGVTSILEFHVVNGKELLFASGSESQLFAWSVGNIRQKELLFKLSGHFSTITNIMISNDGKYVLSCGRDKVVIIWDLENGTQIRTVPIYESVEAATLLPDCICIPGYEKPVCGLIIAVGSENGTVRVFDAFKSKELYTYHVDTSSEQKLVTYLAYNKEKKYLITATADQNITLNNLDANFSTIKQLVGCSDEILDVTYFGENESYLAIAVNSNNINLYDKDLNCSLLNGHTDLVITLHSSPAFPNLLVSGSKDNSIRVWMIKDKDINCVAVGSRHIASVTSVAISSVSSQVPFVVSVSEDTTIKLWHLRDLKFKKIQTLNVTKTHIAHEKPVNSVCISPNDKLIATASQDKTAKIWSAHDLSLIGTLKGHRRGVWSAKFSPVDQLVVTSSADTTLRLWSVADCTCLKTFEGHDSSVLKCTFINKATQIISCGADGLIKIWVIKSGECVATLDKHASKVWALTVSSDDFHFVSGGADSRLIIWRDNTEEEMVKLANEKREMVAKEQHLANLLNANQLLPALELALTLNRPGNALKIIQDIQTVDNDILEDIVSKLSADQKQTLLNYACTWNTNSKHCYVAQLLFSILRDELLDGNISISDSALEGAIAYTDRHFKRMTKLLQDLQLFYYTERMMQPHTHS